MDTPATIPGPLPAAAARRPHAAWPAFYLLGYFLAVGGLLWTFTGQTGQLVFFALIGLFTGAGFLLHARVRPAKKKYGRTLSLALVGSSLFLGAGIFGRQSFQIEGFFFYLLSGVAGGVVVHYAVAKIAGPLLIGRAWCGWGCWIWMVFEHLPWTRSPGPRTGWPWLRVVHFALSLGIVAALTRLLGYHHGFEWTSTDGLWWFLGGCAVYYLTGIGLAAALKDNRAFCKYLCPVTVFLRAGSRVSLLKVSGTPGRCTRCRACENICPMDVRVSEFVNEGLRVMDPECTLCQSCLSVCPNNTLALSLGLDFRHMKKARAIRSSPRSAAGA